MTVQPEMEFPSAPALDGPSALFEIPVVRTPYYHPVNELTEKPQVKVDTSLELASSLQDELPHSAIVRLLISETGEIDDVVSETSTFSESAHRRILATFRKMQFEPGKLDGVPVKSELRIEIMLEDLVQNL